MSEAPPILATWTGEHFVPANKHMVARCAEFFEPNGTYRIEFQDERSAKSHKSFFASVTAAWKNLPEDIAGDFPSPDHLRKWALCKAGFAHERNIVCDTEDDAKRTAALARSLDGFAVIVRRGNVVKVYTAKSQSQRSMKKDEFQASNQAVRNILADLLKVTPQTIDANADHDTDHQRNPIPADHLDRPDDSAPPQRPHTPQTPAEKTLPLPSSGASTVSDQPDREPNPTPAEPAIPEEKIGSGRDPLPTTYRDLVEHIKAWTSFIKEPKRFSARVEQEKRMLWPTMNPPLTAGQINHLESLLDDKASRL